MIGFIENRACYLVRNKPEWYEYMKHLCTARAEECTTVASPSFNQFKNVSFFILICMDIILRVEWNMMSLLR